MCSTRHWNVVRHVKTEHSGNSRIVRWAEYIIGIHSNNLPPPTYRRPSPLNKVIDQSSAIKPETLLEKIEKKNWEMTNKKLNEYSSERMNDLDPITNNNIHKSLESVKVAYAANA